MNSEWECLRLAAKATDRDKAFREHWPAVEAQLRQWGYPSWGIAQAHLVLSSGGSVNEAVEALRELWAKFDRAVKQLGIALEGESIRAIADAFSQLAAHTRQIADAIAPPAEGEQDAGGDRRAS